MKANRLAFVGVLFGLAGAVLLALFVASDTSEPETVTTTVLVAGDRGIEPGTRSADVAAVAVLREVPVDVAPARAIDSTAEVEGLRAARPIGPGEILTTDQFAAIGPASGGVVVPEGWEAISVEALPAPGLEGYATPGSLVNLYLTATPHAETLPDGTPDRDAARPFTQLLMAHTEVLAVTRGTLTGESSAVNEAAASGTLVFLLKVRPADVPTLVFAEHQGSLWFSLANADDPSPTPQRITVDDLDPAAIARAVDEARTQLERDRELAAQARAIRAEEPAVPEGSPGAGAE